MALSDRLTRAQEILGHEFNNKVLLRAALTHPSAVEGQPVSASYERLEFLGDSILGAVVARSLFESYPEFDEGKLTRLKVSLGLGCYAVRGFSRAGHRRHHHLWCLRDRYRCARPHSALENVYESLVGALYLDAGWDAAAEFIHRTLKPHLASERAEHPANPKSFLQECVQADGSRAPGVQARWLRGPGACAHLYRRGFDRWHPSGSRLRLLKERSRGSRCSRGA